MSATLIDVGCRSADDFWLNEAKRLTGQSDFRVVGFEPDRDECVQLSQIHPGWILVPLGLWSEAGIKTLYMTIDAHSSSLYPPLQEYVTKGATSHELVGARQIELTTLDEWCRDFGVQPTVIKLDTQGSELDILKGSVTVLPRVEWVISEVEFNPLYEGQPLFGDVDRYLRGFGFMLDHFNEMNCWAGRLMWANAFWNREP